MIDRARTHLFAGGANQFEQYIMHKLDGARMDLFQQAANVAAHAPAVDHLMQLLYQCKDTWPGDAQLLTLTTYLKTLQMKATSGALEVRLKKMINEAVEGNNIVSHAAVLLFTSEADGLAGCRLQEGDPCVELLQTETKSVMRAYEEGVITDTVAVSASAIFCAAHLPEGHPSIVEFDGWALLCKMTHNLTTAVTKYRNLVTDGEVLYKDDTDMEELKKLIGAQVTQHAAFDTIIAGGLQPSEFFKNLVLEAGTYIGQLRTATIESVITPWTAQIAQCKASARGAPDNKFWFGDLDNSANLTDALDAAQITGGLFSLPNYEAQVTEIRAF